MNFKKEIKELIKDDFRRLALIPLKIKSIEKTEYPIAPWKKNHDIRFWNERRIQLLDGIKFLNTLKDNPFLKPTIKN